jgi:hypothetical protein
MSAATLLETHLRASGQADPARLAGAAVAAVAPERLATNLVAVQAEVVAPVPSPTARLLGRVGFPDATLRLVSATPGLRRSWWLAVSLAVLFALAVADGTRPGADSIRVFLTLAPLVPLLGVALAFGPRVDPAHDLVVAAPRDAFRVFLVRAATVLAASVAVLGAATLLLPDGGWHRVAWLLPALATTSAAGALATRIEAKTAAAVVGGTWLLACIVAIRITSAAAAFGLVMQATCLCVVGGAAGVIALRHRPRRLPI